MKDRKDLPCRKHSDKKELCTPGTVASWTRCGGCPEAPLQSRGCRAEQPPACTWVQQLGELPKSMAGRTLTQNTLEGTKELRSAAHKDSASRLGRRCLRSQAAQWGERAKAAGPGPLLWKLEQSPSEPARSSLTSRRWKPPTPTPTKGHHEIPWGKHRDTQQAPGTWLVHLDYIGSGGCTRAGLCSHQGGGPRAPRTPTLVTGSHFRNSVSCLCPAY